MSNPFYSQKYQDIYFNPENPEAEKQFVFIDANRIGERIRDAAEFTVAELGFGFGLNCSLTVRAARLAESLSKLKYFSVDEELPASVTVRALSGKLSLCRPEYDEVWQNLQGYVQETNALAFLGSLASPVDAWYFDGFSPTKNPKMWSLEVFQKAFTLTRRGGTFSTYSSAGWVRRNLLTAGFAVEKVPGFGGKREMLKGYRP